MNEKDITEYFLGLLGQIKLHHWSTMSYAIHKALDELHGELSGLVDKFVEVYIGRFNKQPLSNFTIKMEAKSDTTKIMGMLEKERENIRKMHKQLKSSTELQNILDEMMSSINNTIYLCNLK
jgi:DNA-binding ferritin-like protein